MPVCERCLDAPQPLTPEYFCCLCGTPFRNAFPLDAEGRCGLCRRGLTPFDAAFSYGAYENELRSLVHQLKYGGLRTLAPVLGRRMALVVPRRFQFDAIVPVPLHWTRQWRRGYNQAELLAEEVARSWSVPMRRLLRRVRRAPAQAGLSAAGRRKNTAGTYELSRGADAAGLVVLLVDDVFTTGATASACAAALKRGGAKQVAVLTLARADRRPAETGGTPPAPERLPVSSGA